MNNYRSLIQSPLFDGVSISDAACGEVRPIIVDHQFKGGIAEVEYRFIRFDPGQHLGASAEKQHVASCNQFFIDAVRFHPGNQRDVGVDDILSRKFCIQMVQSQDKLGKKRGGIHRTVYPACSIDSRILKIVPLHAFRSMKGFALLT